MTEPQRTLYRHKPHPHISKNANVTHDEEIAQANQIDLAIMWVNDKTATMYGILIFMSIGVCSLIGYFTGNVLLAAIFGAVSSYLLQLVYLALLMYSGKKSDRARQIQSDEMYRFSENTYHDTEQIMRHLAAQDAAILTLGDAVVALTQQGADNVDAIAAHLTTLHTTLTAALTPPPVAEKAPRSRRKISDIVKNPVLPVEKAVVA